MKALGLLICAVSCFTTVIVVCLVVAILQDLLLAHGPGVLIALILPVVLLLIAFDVRSQARRRQRLSSASFRVTDLSSLRPKNIR